MAVVVLSKASQYVKRYVGELVRSGIAFVAREGVVYVIIVMSEATCASECIRELMLDARSPFQAP